MSAAIPLSREDRDILALESATVAGHTCKVVVLGEGAPSVDELRASVAARLPPMLTWKLGGDRRTARRGWRTRAFASRTTSGPRPRSGPLPEVVAELFEQRLDRSRPLWRMDVLDLEGGGSALAWRIHHALADGQTCIRLAEQVLWDSAPPPRPAHAQDAKRRRAHLAGFVRREFGSSTGRSPFDGKVGARRRVAFASVPLQGASRRGEGARRRHAERRGPVRDRGGATRLDRGPSRPPRGPAGAGAGEHAPPGRGRGQPRLLLLRGAPAAPARPGGPAASRPRGGGAAQGGARRRGDGSTAAASWRACRRACSGCASVSRPAHGTSP